MPSTAVAPVGVFDSGVGGLSVLRALQQALPHERFVYFADDGHAPYGERSEGFVRERSLAIAARLRRRSSIKALVVACNTATAAAIAALRAQHPGLPVVGVEPALKPAVQATRTGRIGVLATRATVASAKFSRLLASLRGPAEFVVQPCDGLASAIEASVQTGTRAQVAALCARYLGIMGPFGARGGQIDTLVLGCTHYIFAEPELRQQVGAGVQLLETGAPVARRTRHVLAQSGLLAPPRAAPGLQLCSSGDGQRLQAAAALWLPGRAKMAAGSCPDL